MRTVQKILIIRFSSLGDIVLATPLISRLRKKFPEAQVDFLIRTEYAELLQFNPKINNLIRFDIHDGFRGLRKLKNQVKKTHYDVILDIHNNLRSRYVCLNYGRFRAPAQIWHVRKQKITRFLLVKCKVNLYQKIYGRIIPVWEKYLLTAKSLGIDLPDETQKQGSDDRPGLMGDGGLEIYISHDAENTAAKIRKGELGDAPYITLAPGARHFTKRWPAEYYSDMINLIYQEKNIKSVLIGGKDDQSLCENIVKDVGGDRCLSLSGKLTILETAAMINNAKLLITNDSGLMHVGDALKTPLLTIFGSTVQELGFFPTAATSMVVENKELSCRPCSHIGRSHCPKKHFRCMKELTPDQLWQRVKKIL